MRDAARLPLEDRVDVDVVAASTNATVAAVRDVSGQRPVRVPGLRGGEAFLVKVFPSRHRPVGHFVMAPHSGEREVEVFSPLVPERVQAVRFPAFEALPRGLQDLLGRGGLEGAPKERGPSLYDRLGDLQKAGLLNIYAKAARTAFPNGSTPTDFMEKLYRIRGDRIFADVALPLRDLVKTAATAGPFREVSAELHTPPPGFSRAGSFKTEEPYGNLQITFFASEQPPLRFKTDIDIDDAAGIEHLFQVLRNWITQGATHPYDIHQILLFHQWLHPGYDLIA